MAPALEALGRRIEDVRWILLTHGHIDHVGGAQALWELTGRRAEVVVHQADAPFLRSRRGHVDEYLHGRQRYLRVPDGEQQQASVAQLAISGELEPTLQLSGGERLDLGGGISLSAHHVPGHTAGSVAYVLDGQDDVFVGDAVQVHGAANRFPGFTDPDAYRTSLRHLLDDVRPRRLFLGHPYQTTDGTPFGLALDRDDAAQALTESLEIEARIRDVADQYLRDGLQENGSAYSPFARVADELGYQADPRLEPAPFFTTLDGYRRQFAATAPCGVETAAGEERDSHA
jgi:glyoxylase-like metal-dependent hydrolase (beta-lactamase superfamily II)